MFRKQPELFLKNPASMSAEEVLEEMKETLDRLNMLWPYMSRPYSLWIDWDHKPRRIVMTAGIKVDRTIIHP